MKSKFKIALTIAATLFGLNQAQAQDTTPHELSVSYGFATSDMLKTAFIKLFVPGDDALNALGPIGLKYGYHLNDRVVLGLNTSYAQLTLRESADANGHRFVKSRSKYYTVLPEVNVYLGKKERVEAYSGLAVGVSHLKYEFREGQPEASSDTETVLAYHVTALGIRGTKQTGFFAELGFGYKGLLQLGVSHRF